MLHIYFIELTDNQSLVSVDYCDDLSYMGRQLKAVSDKYIMEIADKDKEIKFLQNQLKGFRSKIENMERYFEDTRQTLQDLSTQTSYQSVSIAIVHNYITNMKFKHGLVLGIRY